MVSLCLSVCLSVFLPLPLCFFCLFVSVCGCVCLVYLPLSLLQGAESDSTHFTDKIEINDYPQQARWKITQKSTVNEVVEITGVAIITKGE